MILAVLGQQLRVGPIGFGKLALVTAPGLDPGGVDDSERESGIPYGNRQGMMIASRGFADDANAPLASQSGEQRPESGRGVGNLEDVTT